MTLTWSVASNSVCTSKKTHSLSKIKKNHLNSHRVIMRVYCENYIKAHFEYRLTNLEIFRCCRESQLDSKYSVDCTELLLTRTLLPPLSLSLSLSLFSVSFHLHYFIQITYIKECYMLYFSLMQKTDQASKFDSDKDGRTWQ